MAISITRATSGESATGGPYTTAAVSYVSGDALILAFTGFGTGFVSSDTLTVTSNNMTWTKLSTSGSAALGGIADYYMLMYYGVATGTGSSVTISITSSRTLDEGGWIVDKATGVAAIPVKGAVAANGSSATATSTLTGLTAGNSTWAVGHLNSNSNTAEAGQTRLSAANGEAIAPFGMYMFSMWRNDITDTTPSITLSTGQWAFVALEVVVADEGPPVPRMGYLRPVLIRPYRFSPGNAQ